VKYLQGKDLNFETEKEKLEFLLDFFEKLNRDYNGAYKEQVFALRQARARHNQQLGKKK
jgi:hypothetical protein